MSRYYRSVEESYGQHGIIHIPLSRILLRGNKRQQMTSRSAFTERKTLPSYVGDELPLGAAAACSDPLNVTATPL